MKPSFTKLLFALTLCTLSCKKEETESQNQVITAKDLQVANGALEVDRFINELEFVARSIKTGYPNQPGILAGTTMSIGYTTEGKTKYDIVFNNATGSDNKKRTGKLTVVYEDAIENGVTIVGKHLHVRSDDEASLYTVGGIKFKGSLIFTNITASQNSSLVSIDHLNAQSFLIFPGGEQIKFASTRKATWTAGNNTADIADDVFEINNVDYSLDLISPTSTDFAEIKSDTKLTLNYCNQSLFIPKKGVLKVDCLGGNVSYLWYGNGDCSDIAKLLSNK